MKTALGQHFKYQHRLGVTIIELLVVVVVIAVLLSIVIPVLGKVRGTAQEVQSLSNLRGIGITFQTYSNDNGHYPSGRGSTLPGTNVLFGFNIWLIDRYWPFILQRDAPWEEHFESWISPGKRWPGLSPIMNGEVGAQDVTSYYYSTSFIASPQLWDGRTSASEDLISPRRASEVRSPSKKVMVYDRDRAYLLGSNADSQRPLLFADGSARLRSDSEAIAPVENPLARQSPTNRPPTRYQDTPNGIKGRDF